MFFADFKFPYVYYQHQCFETTYIEGYQQQKEHWKNVQPCPT